MKALSTIPILRIFDVPKALEFYQDYLGSTVDWEHRFNPESPVNMQVSRGGMVLHLSGRRQVSKTHIMRRKAHIV